MIVISAAGVLYPELGLNNPFFGYRNLITGVDADSEDADHPASNLLNVLTFPDAQWWSGSTSAQNVEFEITGDDVCDYAAIAEHNFGTAGITVKWQAFNGSTWDDLTNEVLPGDDSPLIFRYAAQPLDGGVRMVCGAGSQAPRCAIAYVGPSLIAQRRLYVGHMPIRMARTTDVVAGMSETADFLGRIVTAESVGNTIDLKNLTAAWVRDELDPFLVAAKTAPFFFAWRPEEFPLEVAFCWLTNQPKPVNQRNNGMMSVQLQVNGIV